MRYVLKLLCVMCYALICYALCVDIVMRYVLCVLCYALCVDIVMRYALICYVLIFYALILNISSFNFLTLNY